MPTTEKRGRKHRGIAFHEGQKIFAGTYATKAEALAAAVELEKKAKSGKLAASASGRTLADLFEKYHDEVSPTKPGARWEQIRLKALMRDPVARKPLDELSSTDFAEYKKRRLGDVKSATVLRDFHLISHAFTIARTEWRWVNASPLSELEWPEGSPPRDQLITDEHIEKMCFVASYTVGMVPETYQQKVMAALVLAIESGLRSGEILALKPGDVFLDKRYLKVRAEVAGGQKTAAAKRDVPLSTRACAVLKGMLELKLTPIWDIDWRRRDALFRKVRDKAGIKGITFHDSRHSACTRLAKKMGILDLARVLGHKDLRMLQVYYNEPAHSIAERLD